MQPVKLVKIVVGCCLALAVSEAIGLRFATSSVIIAMLSIQDTRRDTFRVAGRRCCAFAAAAAIACLSFTLLHFSALSLAVYLLLFVAVCQWLHLEEGMSMSTVLMLHLWTTGAITLTGILNETILMAIGITAGILTNWYMPRQTAAIRADQQAIEDSLRRITAELADAVAGRTHPEHLAAAFSRLDTLLTAARKRAAAYAKNSFHQDARYYLHYIDMRAGQRDILARIRTHLPRLGSVTEQAHIVQNFMLMLAGTLHEHDNAADMLAELERTRQYFRTAPLPETRTEFETRAVLFEIVRELQLLLEYKRDFARSLTPSQIEAFWHPVDDKAH